MHNMMQSIARYLVDNAATLGIPAVAVQVLANPDDPGDTDEYRRTITFRELITESDPANEAFNGSTAEWPSQVDNYRSVIEILVTCRPAQADLGRDYYPNEARALASRVQNLLRGVAGTGLIINRTAWDKTGTPVEGDGQVAWPPRIATQPQDDEDPAHVIVLTFELNWWAPAPTT